MKKTIKKLGTRRGKKGSTPRLGIVGYATILKCCFRRGGSTLREIAESCGRARVSQELRDIVERMRQFRLLHIAGWQKPAVNGPLVAKYAAGDCEDAPYPGKRPVRRRDGWRMGRISQKVELFALLVQRLDVGNAKHAELVASSGLARSVVTAAMHALRGARHIPAPTYGSRRIAYISGWEPMANMGWKPAYSLASPFAPCPSDVPKPAIRPSEVRFDRGAAEMLQLIHMTAGRRAPNVDRLLIAA